MRNHSRIAISAVGVAAALLLVPALGTAADGARPVPRNCSVAGLHYSYKEGSATFSVAVSGLKSRTTSCPTARSLAGTVAKDILHGTKVPGTVAGFKVTAKEPCTGCTPDTAVTARSGNELITFTVRGGA